MINSDIGKELLRQDEKWGKNRNIDPYGWLVILGEEYGEACKATLEGNKDEYRQELIHVAAVAISALECFDRKEKRRKTARRRAYLPTGSDGDEE